MHEQPEKSEGLTQISGEELWEHKMKSRGKVPPWPFNTKCSTEKVGVPVQGRNLCDSGQNCEGEVQSWGGISKRR
eukprot:3704256-Karenia_brevis.AAC.1